MRGLDEQVECDFKIGRGAFGKIVDSFVKDIVTPLIAALIGKPDFSALVVKVNGGVITYGTFLNNAISFLLIAIVVYFLIVVPMNFIAEKSKKPAPVAEVTTKGCPQCLSEIPLAATRCKFCTQAV